LLLPTHFLLPEKKVGKESWYKGEDPPYISPLSARKTQPTRHSARGFTQLLARYKNITFKTIKTRQRVAGGFVPPSLVLVPRAEQKGGELAGWGASVVVLGVQKVEKEFCVKAKKVKKKETPLS